MSYLNLGAIAREGYTGRSSAEHEAARRKRAAGTCTDGARRRDARSGADVQQICINGQWIDVGTARQTIAEISGGSAKTTKEFVSQVKEQAAAMQEQAALEQQAAADIAAKKRRTMLMVVGAAALAVGLGFVLTKKKS
jgi:hypothetical protein